MTDYNEQIFGGGEFVMTQTTGEDGKPQFVGGGYKINLFNIPLTTLNKSNYSDTNDELKASSLFDNLVIPSGLFYIHQKGPKEQQCLNYYEPHKTLSDDIFDKFFELVEYDKKRQRKTRKQNGGQIQVNRKTRRNK